MMVGLIRLFVLSCLGIFGRNIAMHVSMSSGLSEVFCLVVFVKFYVWISASMNVFVIAWVIGYSKLSGDMHNLFRLLGVRRLLDSCVSFWV